MTIARPVKKPLVLQSYRDAALSLVTLASWRWRPHWFLLLIISVGMVAAVMIVCTVPLLSNVMLTAGVRSVLTSSPTAGEIALRAQTGGLSSATIQAIEAIITPPLQQDVQDYVKPVPRLDFQTPEFGVTVPGTFQAPTRIYATALAAATSHISLLQGRFPRPRDDGIEIMVTPDTASAWQINVGSVVPLSFTSYKAPTDVSGARFQTYVLQNIKLYVVGSFTVNPNDEYWHGETFLPDVTDTGTHYSVLTADQSLLTTFDNIAKNQLGASEVYFSIEAKAYFFWYYTLDATRVSSDNMNDLIGRLSRLQDDENTTFSNLQNAGESGDIEKLDLSGAVLNTDLLPSSLVRFSSHVAVARIPASILALQIVGLILFFIIGMVEMLIDRQSEAIALLHSRGASSWQIFGSIMTQGIVLSLFALIIGPLLAFVVVVLIITALLPLAERTALDVLTRNPLHSLLSIQGYAFLAVALIVVVMLFALFRASRTNVLGVRREAARSTQRPLWVRLNLDLVAALVALSGYGVTVYLTNVGNLLDAQTQSLVAAPLALIAPIFLLFAVGLLFLRFFPAILSVATRLVVRGRGAAPMLAVAQMARSPRQAMRMIAILALATAFAIFTLVLTASQTQRVQDITSFQTGADFSGDSTIVPYRVPTEQQTTLYRHIPGVLAASVGHIETDELVNATSLLPIQILAIDPATFAQTLYWLPQNSTQPVSSLMTQLSTGRQAAIKTGTIPAIVDVYTLNQLSLHVGATFILHQDNAPVDNVTFTVVSVIQHIPSVNNSLTVVDSNAKPLPGGMMVDYQSYTAVQQASFGIYIPPEHVWLRTLHTPQALTTIRNALQTPRLHLDNLYDRYAINDALVTDPLYLNLLVLLTLGACTALLLAVIGDMLASWLSVRVRLTQFALLRAQGASQHQVISVLLWEQGIIYTTALFLGGVLGVILAVTVVPVLVFSSVPVSGVLSLLSNAEFYVLQQAVSPRIVAPFSLVIAFLVLVALCCAALLLMARVALHPSMSQVLRLDED